MFDDETKKILAELKLSSLVDELEEVSKSKERIETAPLQSKIEKTTSPRPRVEEKKSIPLPQSNLKSYGILVTGFILGLCVMAFFVGSSPEVVDPAPQIIAIADSIDSSSADFGPEHQELLDILQERKEVLSEISKKMSDLVDSPHESTQLVHELVEYVQDFSRLNDCYMDEIRDKIESIETMLEGNDKLLRKFHKQLVQLKIQ